MIILLLLLIVIIIVITIMIINDNYKDNIMTRIMYVYKIKY